MVLGLKSDLDHDFRQYYIDAGVGHILAVSGLHVGIVILFVSFILYPLRYKRFKSIYFVLTVLCVWIYAFITGLSPSVVRTSFMYTVYVVGLIVQRKPSSINCVSFVAVIMLVYNPLYLFDIGFQLSFACVYGIIACAPYLNKFSGYVEMYYRVFCKKFIDCKARWVYTRRGATVFNRCKTVFFYTLYIIGFNLSSFSKKLTIMFLIGFSSQIFCYGLILYSFHRYNLYSSVCSVVLIPLATFLIPLVIIYFGIYGLVLLFGCGEWLSNLILRICGYIAWMMNELVIWTSNLKFSYIDNIPFTTGMLLVSVLLSLSLVLYFMYRNKIMLVSSGIVALVFGIMIYGHVVESRQKTFFAVYDTGRISSINITDKGRSTLFITKNQSEIESIMSSHFANAMISSIESDPESQYISVSDKRILILRTKDDLKRLEKTGKKITSDIVVISYNACNDIDRLRSVVSFSDIVVDGSNSAYTVSYWKKAVTGESEHCHIVELDGSYILNL